MTDTCRTALLELQAFRKKHRIASTNVLVDDTGSAVNYNQARMALRRVLNAIDVPSRGIYGFRHAFGLRLADRGLGIHRIKTLMGHTSIETTQIYMCSDVADFADDFREVMR